KGLEILTTGDPDGSKRAIGLLRQLISLAPAPSEAYLAEAARQKAEEKAEEERKQTEKAKADQAQAEKIQTQLSVLQGSWHARLGHSTSASGRVHSAGSTLGSFNGTVNVREDFEYDLTMSAPSGNSVSGRYSYGNETWQLRGSELPSFENECFVVL